MIKVGLLSDTHAVLIPEIYSFFSSCDEIWHAGDIGNITIARELQKNHLLRAVYGNIDDTFIRKEFPETQTFTIEGLKVLMIHIGGYPGRYSTRAREMIQRESPGLFISGHSHILKVMNDTVNKLLHINPGAAGKQGLHQKISCIRFTISKGRVTNLEILEKKRS